MYRYPINYTNQNNINNNLYPVTYNQPKKLDNYQKNAKAQNPAIDSHLESPYIKKKYNQFTNQYQEYPDSEVNLTKEDIDEVQKFVDSHVSRNGKLNDLNLFIPFDKKTYLYRSRKICENNLKDNIKYDGKSIKNIQFYPSWNRNSCKINELESNIEIDTEKSEDVPEDDSFLSSYQFEDKDFETENKNEEIGKVIFDKDSINAIILSEYYEDFKFLKPKPSEYKNNDIFVIYRIDDGSWIKGKIISNEKYKIIKLNEDGSDNIYIIRKKFYKTIQDDIPSDIIYPKLLKFQERNILESVKMMVIKKLKNDCDCEELQNEIELSQAKCKEIVDEKNDTIKNFEGKSFNLKQIQKIKEIIRKEIGGNLD